MSIIISIRCDRCGLGRDAKPGMKAHQLRKKLREQGWRRLDRDKQLAYEGKHDLCPNCAAEKGGAA